MNPPSGIPDGVTVRRATPEDAPALEAFVREVFLEEGRPDLPVAIWTRDLLERPHPRFEPGLLALAVDGRNGEIVASTALIPQTWTYGGIPFPVGRPEIVGTRAAYRRRGLASALMGVVHDWSAGAGHLVQAITGIPWFYRRFGYEMALDLAGGASCPLGLIPPAAGAEPCTFRPATVEDVPFLTATYRSGMERFLVATEFDDDLWRLELTGRSDGGSHVRRVAILERADEPIGLVVTVPDAWQGALWVTAFELIPGVSWGEMTPAVLRWLEPQAEAEDAWCLRFACGPHPSMQVLPHALKPAAGYEWYLRVPDLAGFIGHVTPVVERNLASGPFVGHSGRVRISLYTRGFVVVIEKGRVAAVEPWRPEHLEDGDVLFPDLTFLRVLFGAASLAELSEARADCRIQNRPAAALLDAMFPKRPSSVLGVA